MHILFLLLPIFDFQIHDIGWVCGGIQGRELFGDTGKQEGVVVDSLMSRWRCSVQVLAAAWLRDGHTWGCVAGLWCVGPAWGTLRMRHWGVIVVMPTWRKCSTNSFNIANQQIQFRWDRWDGWVVVTECKYKSEGRLRDVEYVDTKSGIHPSLKVRS